jgi:hypothetical protein
MILTEKIYDVTTGETTFVEREETAEEIANREKLEAAIAKHDAEQAAKAAAKQAVLDKLGLTADEVQALLG